MAASFRTKPGCPARQRQRWLDSYVKPMEGGLTQRTKKWEDMMSTTYGGSEIAALMHYNPYKSREEAILAKLSKGWDGGSVACWWGTLFEDVGLRVLELDCDTLVSGDSICIQKFPGSRLSPDGFCVVYMYHNGDRWCLWTVGCGVDKSECRPFIVLLEGKCPYNRWPDGKITRYYLPQIWYGLAVAPIAVFGLFVDAAFRKCSLEQLGPSADFDDTYHRPRAVDGAYAWGLTAIYAPYSEIVEGKDEKDPNAPTFTEEMAELAAECESYVVEPEGIIDFGLAPKEQFDRCLGFVDRKIWPVKHSEPCFMNRGHLDVTEELANFRKTAALGYRLLGVLPWKLFEIHYVPELARPGFLASARTLVAEALETQREAVASGDSTQYLRNLRGQREAVKNAARVSRFFSDMASDRPASSTTTVVRTIAEYEGMVAPSQPTDGASESWPETPATEVLAPQWLSDSS
jgi:hypothetical protein